MCQVLFFSLSAFSSLRLSSAFDFLSRNGMKRSSVSERNQSRSEKERPGTGRNRSNLVLAVFFFLLNRHQKNKKKEKKTGAKEKNGSPHVAALVCSRVALAPLVGPAALLSRPPRRGPAAAVAGVAHGAQDPLAERLCLLPFLLAPLSSPRRRRAGRRPLRLQLLQHVPELGMLTRLR